MLSDRKVKSAITNNHSTGNGGGVYVWGGATFIMSGGSITNNTATNMGKDVYLFAGGFGKATAHLSGNAQIGNLALDAYINRATITISSNTFSGSVGSVDLGGGASNWMSIGGTEWDGLGFGLIYDAIPSTPVIVAGEGVTLTRDMIRKFTLGAIINTDGTRKKLPTETELTTISHCKYQIHWGFKDYLYGVLDEHTDTNMFGRLITNEYRYVLVCTTPCHSSCCNP